jgi:hypothetical protein
VTKAADAATLPSTRPRPIWRRIAVIWVVARLLVFGLWAGFGLTTQGDVLYYWLRLHLLATGTPLSSTLVEYPTPVVWFLDMGYWLTGQSRPAYVVAFIVGMLVLDLAFAVALWRSGGTRRSFAVLFWVVFTCVMGPTTYMRFDLVPAVLGGLAVLSLLASRAGLAGSLVGLGAAFKLWPALLWPGTLCARRGRGRATLAFLLVGGGLAVVSLVAAGWNRLVSPLVWQQARGLQVESVWASPLMLVRALSPGRYDVAMSKWQAYEITGDGTTAALTASSVATVLGYVVIVATYALWLRRRTRTVVEAGLIMVLVVTVTIVTNKTFSPQYMMWLGGPLAALLVAYGHEQPGASAVPSWRELRALAVAVLALTLVTQLVYPVLYQPLVHGGPLLLLATTMLVIRNVALVVFLAWVLVLVGRMLLAPSSTDGSSADSFGTAIDDKEREVGP